MIIYCLKCKQKTETLDGVELKSSNGRNMIKGTCSICGTKKSVFLSSKAAAAPQASKQSQHRKVDGNRSEASGKRF